MKWGHTLFVIFRSASTAYQAQSIISGGFPILQPGQTYLFGQQNVQNANSHH